MLLRIPSLQNPDELGEVTRQDKMFEIFKEHHHWQDIIGIRTVGDFNAAVDAGHATDVINISEALQEKKIAQIAEQIAARPGVKLVLLAGPSSSGKTTSCKRLSIQLAVNGLKPLQISLDDYFVDRERTPKDENGEYDYESIYALDLQKINDQFNALFRGEEVELPKYDFQSGKSKKSGQRLKMNDNNVLVVEGIHALNPELTTVCCAASYATTNIVASRLRTRFTDGRRYVLARTSGFSLSRRMPMPCSIRPCSTSWLFSRCRQNRCWSKCPKTATSMLRLTDC